MLTDRSVERIRARMVQRKSQELNVSLAEGARSIIDAAEVLFSEKGFAAVSLHEIAARAGVSKANIFHHFESKDGLYLAVLRSACDSVPVLHDLTSRDTPYKERLTLLIRLHLETMLRRERVSRLIQRELFEQGPLQGKKLAEQVFGKNFSYLVGLLREGQQQGELRKDIDPAFVATLLISTRVFFFETRHVLRHFSDVDFADEPARYCDMVIDALFLGIGTSTRPHLAALQKPQRRKSKEE